MKTIKLKVLNKLAYEHCELPQYATEGSAAIDLVSCYPAPFVVIQPSERVLIPTDIAIHIEDIGYAGMILPRSGLGHKRGLILGNSVGLIDSDYQGEIMVSA